MVPPSGLRNGPRKCKTKPTEIPSCRVARQPIQAPVAQVAQTLGLRMEQAQVRGTCSLDMRTPINTKAKHRNILCSKQPRVVPHRQLGLILKTFGVTGGRIMHRNPFPPKPQLNRSTWMPAPLCL